MSYYLSHNSYHETNTIMYQRFSFEAIQGTTNLTNLKVLPPIDHRLDPVYDNDSVNLSDIFVQESEQGSVQIPQPINKIEIMDKQSKNVHFDQFVYIR